MKPPEDAPIYETALFTCWFDQQGILNANAKNIPRTSDNTMENIQQLKSLLHGKKVCALIDVTNSGPIKKGGRECFKKEEVSAIYKAVAILTNSQFGKIAGELLAFLIPPDIPAKVFTNEEEAKKWLKVCDRSIPTYPYTPAK